MGNIRVDNLPGLDKVRVKREEREEIVEAVMEISASFIYPITLQNCIDQSRKWSHVIICLIKIFKDRIIALGFAGFRICY